MFSQLSSEVSDSYSFFLFAFPQVTSEFRLLLVVVNLFMVIDQQSKT